MISSASERMEKKSKYTLFPVPPSSPPGTPLPSLPEDDEEAALPPPDIALPPRRKSSVIDLDPYLPPPRVTSASQSQSTTVPVPLAVAPPILRNPFVLPPRSTSAQHPRNPSPISEEEARPPVPPEMFHSPCSSTSSDSFHKPSTIPQQISPRNRPRTVYFHTGLGGAGNYRKAIREDNILRTTVPGQHRSPRFLASLFGGTKKGRREKLGGREGVVIGEQSSLGAAEIMRRKMLGFGSDGRTGANRN